ncbi:MAG: AraC family transcriptional regulator [Pyrinomonadaceae bacterium]
MESKTSVGFVRDVILYASTHGVSTNEMCRELGISPDILLRPDEMVSGDLSHRAWLLAEQLTGDSDIGLHIGERAHPAVLGLVGFVMLSCETLGEALEKLIRYTNLLTDGVAGKITRKGRLVEIDILVKNDVVNSLSAAPRQRIETSFAAIVTIAKALTDKELPIRELRLVHERPPDVSEHARIFNSPVLFSQEDNSLVFAASAMEFPVLLANSDLLSMFEAKADSKLGEMERDETRTMQVERLIIEKLRGEVPCVTEVARTLGVSERTLQRELSNEKTSFSALLDSTRRGQALRHLQDPGTTVAEISFLLGFSEPSAFHRSFKRWTGKTPSAFRSAD